MTIFWLVVVDRPPVVVVTSTRAEIWPTFASRSLLALGTAIVATFVPVTLSDTLVTPRMRDVRCSILATFLETVSVAFAWRAVEQLLAAAWQRR